MKPVSLDSLSGTRFGRWTVIREAARVGRSRHLLCECECGTQKSVYIGNLQQGSSHSCGCLSRELTSALRRTHGASNRPEYGIWGNMKSRCGNPNVKSYADYGQRGIVICPEWSSFERFYADMGPRPHPGMTLERKDNNGPYSKENCMWATRTVQNSNTRANIMLTHGGVTQTAAAWSKQLGGKPHLVTQRIHRYGWDVERAVTEPAKR